LPVGLGDVAVIAGQLGRPPRDLTGVAVRCPFGYPAVIETAPVFSDGTPNPNLLYLTCPTMTTCVSGVEASGGVRRFRSECHGDTTLARFLEGVTRAYRARRAALATGRGLKAVRVDTGIGGPTSAERASCLHAYGATLLAVMAGWLWDGPGPGAPGSSSGEWRAGAAEVWARFLPPVAGCWCKEGRCARWSDSQIRAAIDVGTISVRLLVAEVAGRRSTPLVRKTEITRLGESLEPDGPLLPAARARTAAAVSRFGAEARQSGADMILITGTSAARDAIDGSEFLRSLGRENSVAALVLSGSSEARLALRGASLDVEGRPVVLDIGGGSTELIRAGGDEPQTGAARAAVDAVESVSLKLGASRATERWIASDPPTTEELCRVSEETRKALTPLRDRFGAGAPGRPRLVGVAGTVTTLACLDAGLEAYDADALHLRPLAVDTVRRWVERLAGMTTEQRATLPCVQAGRAPVIVAGGSVLLAAMETLGYAELTVSERDVLDGSVLEAGVLWYEAAMGGVAGD